MYLRGGISRSLLLVLRGLELAMLSGVLADDLFKLLLMLILKREG